MSFSEEWQRRLQERLEVEEYARCLRKESDDRGSAEFQRQFFQSKLSTKRMHEMILHIVDQELSVLLHDLELDFPKMVAESLVKVLTGSSPTWMGPMLEAEQSSKPAQEETSSTEELKVLAQDLCPVK